MRVDYSRRARDYDSARADEATDREFWLRGLVEIGRIQPGERVLDLGAGTGRFASLLQGTNPAVALDPSWDMLTLAHAKGPFPCILGDAHQLPFRRDSFDVTVIVMVLHHLANFEDALREVARIGHRVVITTVDLATRHPGILEEAFPSLLSIDRGRFPKVEAIAAATKAAGFPQVRLETRVLHRTLTVDQQLERVRRRYLSTFDLLPPGEFERGVLFLEQEMPRRFADRCEIESGFTFVAGSK